MRFAFWIPLFVFLFAAVYFLMDGTTSNAFSEPDDPAGCLVFTGDGVDDRRVQRHCRTRGVGPALTTVQTVGDPLPTTCLPFRRARHRGHSDAQRTLGIAAAAGRLVAVPSRSARRSMFRTVAAATR